MTSIPGNKKNPVIEAEIKTEMGTNTLVYAGVSTIDDANLELRRFGAEALANRWQTFSFPISEMVGAQPQASSRKFITADQKRIRIIKFLFTKPTTGGESERITIRNPRIRVD